MRSTNSCSQNLTLTRTTSIIGDTPGKILVDSGAFLKNVEQFDHMEFGITAKDAQAMPLSIRKLIELSFLALQDAGTDYRGKNVGCYMSGVAHDLFMISGHVSLDTLLMWQCTYSPGVGIQDDLEAKGAFSGGPAMVANRVSYHLDLRGPSIPVDTACSSSLHATHLAVQALRNGECDQAAVGGCQLNHRYVWRCSNATCWSALGANCDVIYRFTEWLTYSQGGILSPDGKCKPFDATANG